MYGVTAATNISKMTVGCAGFDSCRTSDLIGPVRIKNSEQNYAAWDPQRDSVNYGRSDLCRRLGGKRSYTPKYRSRLDT